MLGVAGLSAGGDRQGLPLTTRVARKRRHLQSHGPRRGDNRRLPPTTDEQVGLATPGTAVDAAFSLSLPVRPAYSYRTCPPTS